MWTIVNSKICTSLKKSKQSGKVKNAKRNRRGEDDFQLEEDPDNDADDLDSIGQEMEMEGDQSILQGLKSRNTNRLNAIRQLIQQKKQKG